MPSPPPPCGTQSRHLAARDSPPSACQCLATPPCARESRQKGSVAGPIDGGALSHRRARAPAMSSTVAPCVHPPSRHGWPPLLLVFGHSSQKGRRGDTIGLRNPNVIDSPKRGRSNRPNDRAREVLKSKGLKACTWVIWWSRVGARAECLRVLVLQRHW